MICQLPVDGIGVKSYTSSEMLENIAKKYSIAYCMLFYMYSTAICANKYNESEYDVRHKAKDLVMKTI